jgi:hypothetical protein
MTWCWHQCSSSEDGMASRASQKSQCKTEIQRLDPTTPSEDTCPISLMTSPLKVPPPQHCHPWTVREHTQAIPNVSFTTTEVRHIFNSYYWKVSTFIDTLKLWSLELIIIIFNFIYLFIFAGTGVCTQGLTFAKQVLYHLSHRSSLFCSSYFEHGGFVSYLPQLASNFHPPDLSLPSSSNCRCEPQVPGLSFLIHEWRNIKSLKLIVQ